MDPYFVIVTVDPKTFKFDSKGKLLECTVRGDQMDWPWQWEMNFDEVALKRIRDAKAAQQETVTVYITVNPPRPAPGPLIAAL